MATTSLSLIVLVVTPVLNAGTQVARIREQGLVAPARRAVEHWYMPHRPSSPRVYAE
jgi:hypothetical protein